LSRSGVQDSSGVQSRSEEDATVGENHLCPPFLDKRGEMLRERVREYHYPSKTRKRV